MKTTVFTWIFGLLAAAGITAGAQERPAEYLGLPGDNLNLYAVMKLFQESETLEGFERSLNDENSRINNLDLNGDHLVDYIMVNDYPDGNVHTIVLRVALDQYESQDVAVFTVERFRDGSVQIQLIGDEDLYGKNYIIEPSYAETPNPGYTGYTGRPVQVERQVTVYVSTWPLIRFIYLPDYYVWRSRWYWGYWPSYWHAWRPYYWHYYYGYHSHWYPHYYRHYRLWHTPRVVHYHNNYYTNIRIHSTHVRTRIQEGRYRDTYSRPDTRNEGEALARKVSRQGSGNSSLEGQRRTASSGSSREAVSGMNRSRTAAVSERGAVKSAVRSSSSQESGVSRRSATSSVNQRGSSSAARVASGEATRRSSQPVTSRGTVQSSTGQTKSASQRPAAVSSRETTTRSSAPSVNNSSRGATTRPSTGQVNTSSGRSAGNSPARVAQQSSFGQTKSASSPAKVQARPSSQKSPVSVQSRPSSQRSSAPSQSRVSSRSSSMKSASVSNRSSSGSSGRSSGRISSGHSSPSRGSASGASGRSGGSSRGSSGSGGRR